jgi:hypothetical protein
MEVSRMKIFEIVGGASPLAFLAWIALSFAEIGFTNFASNWNFLIIITEVFQ